MRHRSLLERISVELLYLTQLLRCLGVKLTLCRLTIGLAHNLLILVTNCGHHIAFIKLPHALGALTVQFRELIQVIGR
jgi:hypothetical protein